MKEKIITGIVIATFSSSICANKADDSKPLNVVLITADDMNYNSAGCMGCPIQNTTPNLDKLAKEGIRFQNAYVNIAVSQPSRAVLATGMYSHNNGVEGFFHTTKNIPTLMSVLGENGYMTGIAGKYFHSTPHSSYEWDYEVDQPELGQGRDPMRYYEELTVFIKQTQKEGKPFYFMVNSHDPHAPFHGSAGEIKSYPKMDFPEPSYIFSPEEMIVPNFLPDLPEVRVELAQYYSSVRRLDDTVGAILKAIRDQGLEENTIVMFLSDNGMDFPFAKTNCYLNSNKTPWIIKWPRVIKQNSTDSVHFISTIDFMPTVLDACGIQFDGKVDGTSFAPILRGKNQTNRKYVFTQFYETFARDTYPMFAVQSADFIYIYNPWHDGSTSFRNGSWGGLTFNAMVDNANKSSEIKSRLNFFKYRTLEEFYDVKKDPDCLNNIINNSVYEKDIDKYRLLLQQWMINTEAWGLDLYQKKGDSTYRKNFVNNRLMNAKKRKYVKEKLDPSHR